ncbi:MAG: Rossmann-like and DUF2520 domain-containing protein [Balneola sp.]
MEKPSISIFGLGRIGGALNKALLKAGYSVHSMFKRGSFPDSIDELGEIIFLAVQDGEIELLSKRISESFGTFEGKYIVHCSGALNSSVLESVSKRGARTASFHPMKAVTDDSSLDGVWFDMEGDSSTLLVLEQLAKDLNAHSFVVKPDAKPLLHAAAVVSANYLVTLLKLATDIARIGGVDEKTALKALLPLSNSSLKNVEENGFEGSLTGPISRGDVETIREHLKILKKDPELLSVYKKLGYLTLNLAELDSDTILELKELLS